MRWALCFAALRLWVLGNDGPDFGQYIEWGYAAILRDIFELRSEVLSPGGVPFNVVASGPGILFATTFRAFGESVAFRNAAYLTGWLAAMVFWSCSVLTLRREACGDRSLTLFGLGALFVGTHAGWYSHVYSTEVFASAFTAALWALAISGRRLVLLECLAAGALTALLLLVRPYLVLYAIAPLGLIVLAGMRDGNRRASIVALRVLAVMAPVAVACAQYAWVNRWMTGSSLRPPYVFSGFGFHSVDFLHPEIAAVLTHPLHGLLAYHPLYGVAFAAIVVQAWRDRERRWAYVATLIAVVVHVWVHASWYVWWLGGGSFGMRGLTPAALPLTVGLVDVIRRGIEHDRRLTLLWVRASVLACAWSFALLLRGNTQFYTWSELLAAQRWALWTIGGAITFWSINSIAHRSWANAALNRAEIRYSALMLLGLVVGYLVTASEARSLPANAVAISLVLAIAATLVAQAPDWMMSGLRPVLLTVALGVFVGQSILFGRLAMNTEERLASGPPTPRQFRYVASAPIDEISQSYAEYTRVRGFDRKKRLLRHFMNWQQIEMARLSPPDRQLAEDVLRALANDETAGGFLLRVVAENGVVRLFSDDTRENQRRRALEVAARVPGVLAVEDWMK